MSFDVVRNLCIESTDWFEERLTYVHLMDDYGNERFFREDNYSTNDNNEGDYHVISYEINTNDGEDNIPEWTEHISKLKELQIVIDDEVKEKVDDGTYLKIMDGLGNCITCINKGFINSLSKYFF